jgi:hypothetical protein
LVHVTTGETETDLNVVGTLGTSVLWGLLTEAWDEGSFSLMQAGLKALAFGAVVTALTIGWPYLKRRRTAARDPERSNPVL